MEIPDGSFAAELATKEILDFAVAEYKAVAGEEVATAVAASSCSEFAGAEAGRFSPVTAAGGAVAPVSATRNVYCPVAGMLACKSPFAPGVKAFCTTIQACVALL